MTNKVGNSKNADKQKEAVIKEDKGNLIKGI